MTILIITWILKLILAALVAIVFYLALQVTLEYINKSYLVIRRRDLEIEKLEESVLWNWTLFVFLIIYNIIIRK